MAVRQPGPEKVTEPTLTVLDLFLSDPGRDDWYGREISRLAGLRSDTVTRILMRFDQWGWVETRWEDSAAAHSQGRPPRRFYKLTGVGERSARQLILQYASSGLRWKPA
jgi:predicted transcriptional regulator